jgi:mono/diheme cytochrome c family protein
MKASMVLVLGVVLAAPQTAAAAEDAVARGKRLFTESKCTMCHSVAGKGNPKGALDGVGARVVAADLRKWLVEPKVMAAKAKAERKPVMPSFETLKKEDLDALVAYLASLKTPAAK